MMNRLKDGSRYISKSNIKKLFDFHFHSNVVHNQRFGTLVDHQLSRDFFVKLWVSDSRMRNPRGKKLIKSRGVDFDPRWFSASSVGAGTSRPKRVLKQPPISQSVSEFSQPESPEEAKVAPLLARSNLLITRDIEWANLVLGFEQENRYAIVDACYPQSPVGLIREQSNIITRQLLRLRRPFVAHITDAMGNELFRVRRPFWWITSSIYAEIDGNWSSSQAVASVEETL
ncbi:hypothetical protein KIW84_073862 [Lathyrus oleraceus]|uniref:Phospholipid scramblase n=1 Tax=Pisum sativum TaxID=3888 RepID=A0A9D4VR41_PEA|nr:hypothetical protein KIW84_073862 [Pisum sativum]